MNDKCAGKYISLVREHKMIKQEMLALDVNISRPMLSKIETGAEIGEVSIINSLFHRLDIDYQDYINDKAWLYNQLVAIYKSVIYGNQNYTALMNNLEKKCECNEYLMFHPEYSLIMLILAYNENDFKSFSKLLTICSGNENYYDDYELAIYMDFYGLKYQDIGEFDESLKIFNSINVFNLPDYLCGMIDYHKGISYRYLNEFYKSTKCFESALEYFLVAQNFNKIVYTQIVLSDIFFKTGNYDLAMETIEKSLDAAYSTTNTKILEIINNNIAWFALIKEDYQKAINHTQQALLYDNTKSEYYFYLVYSYYRLCDTNKSLHYIELAQEYCDENSLNYKMCMAIKKVIKNSKNQITYFEKLYEY